MKNDKLLPCPICDRKVKVSGGIEEWTPTFYDPDSSGDPYYICCKCGLQFSIGDCEIEEFAKAWNTRKPMERIVEQLEEELKLSKEEIDRCVIKALPQYDRAIGYERAIYNALNIVHNGGIE